MSEGSTVVTAGSREKLLEDIDRLWVWVPSIGTRCGYLPAEAEVELSGPVLMAHLGRWDDWNREAIVEHVDNGSVRSYEGYTDWNARWAAEDATLGPGEALVRMMKAHRALRVTLDHLSPEQWDEQVV